ncbi:MAG: hypothetical protein N838_23510 [Thiohalocapsa sp. PB-PSB1]|jgi:hypothetical protein|nr:MAG: hypothetical protein N838_32935 [Thiohalocapsa sp. PB-PSB1]QQO55865.1 MAG: hypothetical protein N838_23510 [Thiohalocapsa sp. PB-PSB1]HCS90766.1 hypothetical protein [Chromatiaceae bacterium]
MTDLVAESQLIAPIPAAAATAYNSALQSLVQQVARRLLAHPRRDELLGGNPPTLFADNHYNHATFMSKVFEHGDYELLATILPWVYHAYHSHGSGS